MRNEEKTKKKLSSNRGSKTAYFLCVMVIYAMWSSLRVGHRL